MRHKAWWLLFGVLPAMCFSCRTRDMMPATSGDHPASRTPGGPVHADPFANAGAFLAFGRDRGRYDAVHHLHDYRHEFAVDRPMAVAYLAYNVNVDGTQDPRSLKLVEAWMNPHYEDEAGDFVRAFISGYVEGFAMGAIRGQPGRPRMTGR